MTGKNEVQDEFLGDLAGNEDIDPLSPESEENLFPEDEVVIEKEEKEEKSLPFHKDPKIQKYMERTIEKRIKDMRPSAEQTFSKEISESGDDDLIRVMTKIVGNDTDEKKAVLSEFKSALDKRDERASQNALKELQRLQNEKSQQEIEEFEDAQNELEEGFDEIESHFGIELSERQKDAYKSFLVKIEPRSGYVEYPDFVETFEIFKNSLKRSSNAQAKVLASRGVERSSSSTAPSEDSFLKKSGNESLFDKFERMRNK